MTEIIMTAAAFFTGVGIVWIWMRWRQEELREEAATLAAICVKNSKEYAGSLSEIADGFSREKVRLEAEIGMLQQAYAQLAEDCGHLAPIPVPPARKPAPRKAVKAKG